MITWTLKKLWVHACRTTSGEHLMPVIFVDMRPSEPQMPPWQQIAVTHCSQREMFPLTSWRIKLPHKDKYRTSVLKALRILSVFGCGVKKCLYLDWAIMHVMQTPRGSLTQNFRIKRLYLITTLWIKNIIIKTRQSWQDILTKMHIQI